MKIPTDYLSGYEIARTIEPDMASKYKIRHLLKNSDDWDTEA